MEKSSNNNGIFELWGHNFKRSKTGLDEEQIVAFVNELMNERDVLLQRQEHLSSLAKLAERTVAEADNVAQQIKNEAVSQAEKEAKAVVAKVEEEAQQLIEEKKSEAIASAGKEAEAIKANARQQAESLLKERAAAIRSELKSTAQRLYRELLSQIEGLKQQVTASEAGIDRMLSQPLTPTDLKTTVEENIVAPGADSAVIPQAEASKESQATEQPDTSQPEEKAPVSAEKQETADSWKEVELEILPPVDISKIMGIITHLDSLPQVKTTELIPIVNKPLIEVFLGEPIDLMETLKALPVIEQLKEVTDEKATDATGDAHTKGKRKKIQVTLSGKPGLNGDRGGPDSEMSHILST